MLNTASKFSLPMLLALCGIFFISYGHVFAKSEPNEQQLTKAKLFVETVANKGIGFLSNSELSQEDKIKEFKTLLKDSFDLKTIGRFALGRYWRQATDAEKEEYTKLFEKMVIDVYANRFGEYQGQDLIVRNARNHGKRDIIVSSVIVSNNSASEIGLDWRLREKNGQFQIIDILVEGISMAVTQRSDFASVIQRGGGNVSTLIEHLRGSQN